MAEEPLRLRVHQNDAAEQIDDHDRIGDGLEEATEPRLDPCRLVEASDSRHVLMAEDDVVDTPRRVTDYLGGDIDMDEGTVLPPMDGLGGSGAGLHRLGEEAAFLL